MVIDLEKMVIDLCVWVVTAREGFLWTWKGCHNSACIKRSIFIPDRMQHPSSRSSYQWV